MYKKRESSDYCRENTEKKVILRSKVKFFFKNWGDFRKNRVIYQ